MGARQEQAREGELVQLGKVGLILIGADLHDPLRRWRGGIGFAQLVAELAVRGWLRGRLRSWLNSYTFSSLKRSLFIRALFVFSLLLMILSFSIHASRDTARPLQTTRNT